MTTTSMIRLAPLSQLAIECSKWSNPRVVSGLSPTDIKELAESVKQTKGPSGKPGPLVPPTVARVVVDGEEITLVIDGQRRWLGSVEAFGKGHAIDVIDLWSEPRELTNDVADDLTLKALTIGNQRATMSSWELSEAAERLRNRGRTLEVIGEAIGRSESWVSKILKARGAATKDLMAAWKAGKVTDEQFKELSKLVESKQVTSTKQVVDIRASDKGEARALTKETLAKSQPAKKPAPRQKDSEVELERREPAAAHGTTNGKSGPTEWKEPPTAVAIRPASRSELEQLLQMAERRAPTDPTVKGIMLGVRYALDRSAIEDFGVAWKKYLRRIGAADPAKAGNTPRKAKEAVAKKKRPAKKSGKKKSGKK